MCHVYYLTVGVGGVLMQAGSVLLTAQKKGNFRVKVLLVLQPRVNHMGQFTCIGSVLCHEKFEAKGLLGVINHRVPCLTLAIRLGWGQNSVSFCEASLPSLPHVKSSNFPNPLTRIARVHNGRSILTFSVQLVVIKFICILMVMAAAKRFGGGKNTTRVSWNRIGYL